MPTPNLNLEDQPLGYVGGQQAFADAMQKIDAAFGAIVLSNSTRGIVECSLKGAGTPYNTGVWMNGTGNSRVEVNCTRLDPARITGGANNKMVNNSVQITATGTFNTNCLASGVMA